MEVAKRQCLIVDAYIYLSYVSIFCTFFSIFISITICFIFLQSDSPLLAIVNFLGLTGVASGRTLLMRVLLLTRRIDRAKLATWRVRN